jgi:hypothetical protein
MIMAWNIIPLDPDPDQEFYVVVEVGRQNIALIIRLRYNTEGECWFMSIKNPRDGKLLLDSAPLVTGEYPAADMLRQYQYLGLGSAMIIPTTNVPPTEIPDLSNLGTEFVLVWGSGEAS